MNSVQESWKQLEAAFVQEILAAKARYIQGVYKRIMPPDLYEQARQSKSLSTAQEWAKREGYRFMENKNETLLMKGNVIAGRFRPVIVGEKAEKHCEFIAFVLGQEIPVQDPVPLFN